MLARAGEIIPDPFSRGQGGPVPCHAMSWLHEPCQILACRAMPYFGVSWHVMNIPCHAVSGFFWKMMFFNLEIFSGIRSQIFDMSSASGYMGEKCFQEYGPTFLACHVIFGVSCPNRCVSWRVNINRVNNFRVVSCQNSVCQHVHAMSWPPWIQERDGHQGSTFCLFNILLSLVSLECLKWWKLTSQRVCLR